MATLRARREREIVVEATRLLRVGWEPVRGLAAASRQQIAEAGSVVPLLAAHGSARFGSSISTAAPCVYPIITLHLEEQLCTSSNGAASPLALSSI